MAVGDAGAQAPTLVILARCGSATCSPRSQRCARSPTPSPATGASSRRRPALGRWPTRAAWSTSSSRPPSSSGGRAPVAAGRPFCSDARGAGARDAAVAFSDDDSWWDPGALSAAAALFGAHERLGLIAARVLVHPGAWLDPTSAAMAHSPLAQASDLPGRRVLGFVACGALVRRDALLDAGGFRDRLGFGGEEALLCLDLAAAGWGLSHVPEVVAHHAPETRGERPERAAREARNAVWTAWLRRLPAPPCATLSARLAAPPATARRAAASLRP